MGDRCPNESGSLAKFTASRRALSLVSSLAAGRRCGDQDQGEGRYRSPISMSMIFGANVTLTLLTHSRSADFSASDTD
jgi:hypothetical protein